MIKKSTLFDQDRHFFSDQDQIEKDEIEWQEIEKEK